MRRVLSFVDERSALELVVPVTPSSYAWASGAAVETIAMDALGELHLRGTKRLAKKTLELLLPAQVYPFCNPGTIPNPWHYLRQFQLWAMSDTPIRYIVSGTQINVAVLIAHIEDYGERDGSGDLYIKLALCEYQRLDPQPEKSAQPDAALPEPTRAADSAATQEKQYSVKKGDTLWGIAQRFYGKGSAYTKIAAANALKNPHLLRVGQTLIIPPADALPPPLAPTPSTQLAAKVQYDAHSGTWR